MVEPLTSTLKEALSEKLAESLLGPIPDGTPRTVFGTTRLSGKATVVVGMRRSGKTTFLHQLRGERLASGAARHCLPYLNFGKFPSFLSASVRPCATKPRPLRRILVSPPAQTVPGWKNRSWNG